MDVCSDRAEAGRLLARTLAAVDLRDPVVIALPPGGVPIASSVATHLAAPLDILVVARLYASHRPDLAIGAMSEDGASLVNEPLAGVLGVGAQGMAQLKACARIRLDEDVARLRRDHPPVSVRRRSVVLIDDGVLTGVSSAIAARALRGAGAARIVLGAPQATPEGLDAVRIEVDDVVVLGESHTIDDVDSMFGGRAVTTEEVVAVLDAHAASWPRVRLASG